MSKNKTRRKDDRVICIIETTSNGIDLIWSISFSEALFDFLQSHVGDVHQWADQQRELIKQGRMNFAPRLMQKVKQGERLTQQAICNAIRAYGISLWFDACDED